MKRPRLKQRLHGYQERRRQEGRMSLEQTFLDMQLEVFVVNAIENGKLLPLLYSTAHLPPHQTHWHSSEQELWGLLHVKRDKHKQTGRIPNVNHTDHANLARMDTMDLHRIEPKHYRWYQEVVEGGSLLLHRPGASALHRGPDGLSRNVEGRDQLILAKDQEWAGYRKQIMGRL